MTPKGVEPYGEKITGFKRTTNAVRSYYLGGQFYHWGTVGRAKEGKVVLTRVIPEGRP